MGLLNPGNAHGRVSAHGKVVDDEEMVLSSSMMVVGGRKATTTRPAWPAIFCISDSAQALGKQIRPS
jgi:hypothetical protein